MSARTYRNLGIEIKVKQSPAMVTLSLLLVLLITLWPMSLTLAQQRPDSISQLKEQIARLETIDKDKDTTGEVRSLNRGFLNERRAQLVVILKKRIEALRKYKSTVQASLSATENQTLEGLIQDLDADIKSTESAISDGSSADLPVVEQPRAQTTRSTAANLALTTPPPVTQPAAPQPDCYPDTPPLLLEQVRSAAIQVLRLKDPSEVGSNFSPILVFTTAHAVAVDAANTDVDKERATLINRLQVRQLQEETKRTDKQIGADAANAGSTSAAEQTGFAQILGFAIEHGAIEKDVNGTTLTLSSSPYALVAASKGDTATTYKESGYLARVGISASFNIENQDNVLTSARRKQLNDWSIRARLTPDRSARSQDVEDYWNRIKDQFAQPNVVITREMVAEFQNDKQLDAKRREIVDRFNTVSYRQAVNDIINDAASTDDQKTVAITKIILCQVKADIFDQVRSGAFRIDQKTRERIINVTVPNYAKALQAREDAVSAFEKEIKRLSLKPAATFAYTNTRATTGSDYSVLKLLFDKRSSEGFKMVGNAGLSLYHKPDHTKNQQTLRDFSAALSLEGNAGRSPFLSSDVNEDKSQITFSFTGRYQRLWENRHVANRTADIGVAQFKLNVPFLSGLSLPISVTYATASELIKEKHVRANFGFTLDTDKLMQIAKLKGLPK